MQVRLEDYVDHLIAGEDDACLNEGLAFAGDVAGLHRLYVSIIQPSQYRVGELWEGGRISVATEHVATAINSYVASSCFTALGCAGSGGPGALIACTPDELHELGARMLADLLECDGWDVQFHGSGVRRSDVIEAARIRRPRFVGLSTALALHLGAVKRFITEIRAALRPTVPPIVVGGNAYRGDAGLWRLVGADLYVADASTAVEQLRSLKS
jgi:MerR family transcriptional regulator, light-induced transcriptional regulator